MTGRQTFSVSRFPPSPPRPFPFVFSSYPAVTFTDPWNFFSSLSFSLPLSVPPFTDIYTLKRSPLLMLVRSGQLLSVAIRFYCSLAPDPSRSLETDLLED